MIKKLFYRFSIFLLIFLLLVPFVRAGELSDEEIQEKLPDLSHRLSLNNNFIYFVEPSLDLGVQVDTFYKEKVGSPQVPLGPSLVVGEGSYCDNHTIVRVFNQHQALISQFLAYPSSVKGGVEVAAGKVENELLVVATPLQDDATKEIRIFDKFGQSKQTISIKEQLNPPFRITTGNFIKETEGNEQLAVVSHEPENKQFKILIYSLFNGELLEAVSLENEYSKGNVDNR